MYSAKWLNTYYSFSDFYRMNFVLFFDTNKIMYKFNEIFPEYVNLTNHRPTTTTTFQGAKLFVKLYKLSEKIDLTQWNHI